MGLWGVFAGICEKHRDCDFALCAFFFIFQIIAFKLPKKRVIRDRHRLSLYIYQSGPVFGRSQCRLPFHRLLSWRNDCGDGCFLAFDSDRHALRNHDRGCGTFRHRAHETGRGSDERHAAEEDHECRALAGRLARGGFSCLRVLSGISIWYILLPGYLLAFILSFFIPKIFTPIAFDSGASVTGRDDRDFPDTLCECGRRKNRRRECLNRRFRPSVHRRFDADTDCSNTGFDLPFQNEKSRPQKRAKDNIIELNEVNDETVGNHS